MLLDNDTSEKTEKNMEQYIRYNDKLEMIPEEVTKIFWSQHKMMVMKETAYRTSKGKMSSSIQPSMTPPMTQ